MSTDSSIRLTPPTVADSSIPGIRHTSLGKGNVTPLHPERGGRAPFRQFANDPLTPEHAGEPPLLVEQREGPPDRRGERGRRITRSISKNENSGNRSCRDGVVMVS